MTTIIGKFIGPLTHIGGISSDISDTSLKPRERALRITVQGIALGVHYAAAANLFPSSKIASGLVLTSDLGVMLTKRCTSASFHWTSMRENQMVFSGLSSIAEVFLEKASRIPAYLEHAALACALKEAWDSLSLAQRTSIIQAIKDIPQTAFNAIGRGYHEMQTLVQSLLSRLDTRTESSSVIVVGWR